MAETKDGTARTTDSAADASASNACATDAAVRENAGGPAEDKANAAGTAQDDGYRETTLEDLEEEPMPSTQRIVLIAAIVLLAVFVLYLICT